MAYLLVRHKVKDYDKWKPVFDEHPLPAKPAVPEEDISSVMLITRMRL